ncbi:MAG: hypothetical protein F4060_17060 [Holophagales bacterium]|nr:hypothetical protein [Holophagales bacterium]MYG30692.1 hypothetical protein [Holophagales bacterium]MYI81632.1 hypothetical protein [Holophagales bacterium]
MEKDDEVIPWSEFGPDPLVTMAQGYLDELEGQYKYDLPPVFEEHVNDTFKILLGLVKAVNCLVEIERQRVRSPIAVLDSDDHATVAIEEYSVDQIKAVRDEGLKPRETEGSASVFRLYDLDVASIALAAKGELDVGQGTLFPWHFFEMACERVVERMGMGGATRLMSAMMKDDDATMDSVRDAIRTRIEERDKDAQ